MKQKFTPEDWSKHPFIVFANIEYTDKNGNVVRKGRIPVGRAKTEKEAQNIIWQTKKMPIEKHVGFDKSDLVLKKGVANRPPICYSNINGDLITEVIKSFDIITVEQYIGE